MLSFPFLWVGLGQRLLETFPNPWNIANETEKQEGVLSRGVVFSHLLFGRVWIASQIIKENTVCIYFIDWTDSDYKACINVCNYFVKETIKT